MSSLILTNTIMGNILVTDTLEQVPIMKNNINNLDKNDTIANENLVEIYANKNSIETTITQISRQDEYKFKIHCNPNKDYFFYLKKEHPNFITLYNSIKIGETYKIIHENDFWSNVRIRDIIHILPCKTHKTTNIIKGFLDIKKELNMNDYHEIVTDDTNNVNRLLINDSEMENIILGQSYKIHYIKAWKSNLYKITKYELCDEIL